MLFSECKDNFLKYKINTIQIKKNRFFKDLIMNGLKIKNHPTNGWFFMNSILIYYNEGGN